MMNRWIVTALGKDRPGIVAGVTGILYKLGCNLEDSAMTRLEGEFAIMLIFSTSTKLPEERLLRAFKPLEQRLKLVVHLKSLARNETGTPRKQGRRYLISVYGADRPGIVFRVADLLSRSKINVTDVHTHRSTGGPPQLYLMLLEVEISSSINLPALERRLKAQGKALGVELSLRSSEADVL